MNGKNHFFVCRDRFDHLRYTVQTFLVIYIGRPVHRHQYIEQRTQTRIVRNGVRVGSEGVTVYPGEQTIRLRVGEAERARLRGFEQMEQGIEMESPVEITFVVPAEKSTESASSTTRRGSRRNR